MLYSATVTTVDRPKETYQRNKSQTIIVDMVPHLTKFASMQNYLMVVVQGDIAMIDKFSNLPDIVFYSYIFQYIILNIVIML